MDSVLIVSNTSATMGIISSMLTSQSFSRIVTAQAGNEARRTLLENDFDLVIIDTPLTDEFGEDFALHTAENTSSGVVMLVDGMRLDDMNAIVEDSGVYVIPKPVAPDFFYQAVRLLLASRTKLLKLEDENRKLQNKLEETRIVGRAKCLLIQKLQLTEEEAHKFIEKQSMNTRQSRLMTAESLIRSYSR